MLDKITVTKEILQSDAKLVGRKPAKLSAMPKFKAKTKSLMDSVVVSKPVNEAPKTVAEPKEQPVNTPVEQPKPPVVEAAPVNLPGVEECQKRINNVGVTLTEPEVNNKLNSTRKLRAAPRVSKVMRFVNGNIVKTSLKQTEPAPDTKEEPKETFDFAKSFNEVATDTPKQEEKPYSWLRNEEAVTTKKEEKADDDTNVVEFQTLMEQKATTADSLATQREILMNLRKKVEENNALCEAKKRDLIEENMALTQELNDVLAEINQLSDTVSQQEAFLGINENAKSR